MKPRGIDLWHFAGRYFLGRLSFPDMVKMAESLLVGGCQTPGVLALAILDSPGIGAGREPLRPREEEPRNVRLPDASALADLSEHRGERVPDRLHVSGAPVGRYVGL